MKMPGLSLGIYYIRGLVRNYFFLVIAPAAGEEPEIIIPNTDFSNRNIFREGL